MEQNENQGNLKKKSSKNIFKNMSKGEKISLPITFTIAAAIGVTVGVLWGKTFFAPVINYNSMDPNFYEDDMRALMNRYNKTDSSNYLTTFKPYELSNIALEKYKIEEHHSSESLGIVVAAGVTQYVKSVNIAHGDNIFSESVSASSLVQTAKRFYENAETVTTYNGYNIKNGSSATWSDDKSYTLSLQEHEDLWGKIFTRPSIYIVSSKTVLDSSAVVDEDGNYFITATLDPVYGVLRYVKQMIGMSDLKRDPIFKDVMVTYKLDKNLNILELGAIEHYTVFVVGENKSSAKMKEIFYHNEGPEIPDLETPWNYTIEKY